MTDYEEGGIRLKWAKQTLAITGWEEPLTCMSYFPVVFKVSHIIAVRKFLEDKWQMPFESFFQQKLDLTNFPQFNVMCTAILHLFEDDYTWYIHDRSPDWDGSHAPIGQWAEKRIFTNGIFDPRPYVSDHLHGHQIIKSDNLGNEHIRSMKKEVDFYISRALCWKKNKLKLATFPLTENTLYDEELCKKELSQGYPKYTMKFDIYDFNNILNTTLIQKYFDDYNARNGDCYHEYLYVDMDKFIV